MYSSITKADSDAWEKWALESPAKDAKGEINLAVEEALEEYPDVFSESTSKAGLARTALAIL